MLLNNFLYTRSLIQNEQFHFRTSFSSLIPKTRVNEDLKNHDINFKLPLSDTKNLNTDDFISINNFILLDDKTKVRAGYTLKSQWFKINNG